MKKIFNISIVAHVDHGKTTLTKYILEYFGFKIQIDQIDDLRIEKEKGITVRSQYYCLQDNDIKLNLIDTPGHVEFKEQVIKFLNCVDCAILVVDCIEGVKPQTEKYLSIIKNLKLNFILCINKIDKLQNKNEINPSILNIKDYLAVFETTAKDPQTIFKLAEYLKNLNNIDKILKNPILLNVKNKSLEGVRMVIYTGNLKIEDKKQYYFGSLLVKIRSIFTNFFSKSIKINYANPGDIVEIIISAKYLNENLKQNISLTKVNSIQEKINFVIKVAIFPILLEDYNNLFDAIKIIGILDSIVFEKIHYPIFGPGIEITTNGTMYINILKERLKDEYLIDVFIYNIKIRYLIDGQNSYYVFGQKPKEVKEPFVFTKFIGNTKLFKDYLLNKRIFIDKITDSEIEGFLPLVNLTASFFNNIITICSGFIDFDYDLNHIKYIDMDFVIISFSIHNTNLEFLGDICNKNEALEKITDVLNILENSCERKPFAYSIRGFVNNRCIKSITVKNYAKDVTAHLYGGDKTRKQKLLKKQTKGRSVLKQNTTVEIKREKLVQSIKNKIK